MNKIFINLSRLFFACLIIFEILNQFKILHYSLTFTWLGLILTSAIIWLGLEILSLYTKTKCNRPIAGWAVLIASAGVWLDALGDIFLLYARFGWYDQVAHFLGGAAGAAVVYSIIKSLSDCQRIRLGLFGKGFFILTTTCFLGVLYELEEYFEDYFRGVHLRLGDGPDTANDLFLNLVGAFGIILIINFYLYVSRRNRPAN